MTGKNILRGGYVLGVCLVLFAAGRSASATYTPPPACRNPFTPQQEVVEGSKVAAQVYQQMPVLPESDPVSQYVAQLGAHLASHAPGQKWPFSYHVVASSDINAFALPGGAIFVNVGTLQAAESEAQLAGVLAHETSHVVLRHSTCNMKKQQTTGLVAGLGSLASQILLGNGAAGQISQAVIGGSNGLYGLRMSRDDEKQADLLGTDILYDTGYDPRGMAQFFEIIQAKYGAGGSQLLTDHPNPGNRTEYVNAEIATLARQPNPMVTSAAFSRMHSAAVQLQAYTAAQVQAGAWKNGRYASGAGQGGTGQVVNASQTSQYPQQSYPGGNQAPAGQQAGQQAGQGSSQYGPEGPVALNRAQLGIGARLTSFRGPNFQVSRPANWQATQDNNNGVTLAPVGGSGTFGTVYGTVVGTAQANGVHDEDSLANATQQLAQQISQGNGGLRQMTQVQALNLNGQVGCGVELQGRSPLLQNGRSLAEHDWLVAVASNDGDLHYMIFVAPAHDFPALRPLFVSMMNSFRAQ